MPLEGFHHVTAITADAQRNVDFYARLLGLRLVKKTVNFDAPDVYHLYYGDELGAPGSILTFFEFPAAAPGRHGAGMPYRIEWRVADAAALEFWAARLEAEGVAAAFEGDTLRFDDPEGLEHALVTTPVPDPPLRGQAADVPAGVALQGLHGVRAYAADPAPMVPVLRALGFEQAGGGAWEAAGAERRGHLHLDPPPQAPGRQGAGSIHHIAWSAADDDELLALRRAVAEAGLGPTPIIDRQYFHSVYFRTPAGVLFELATRDIGFTVDEPAQSLGEALKLPPQHEPLREQLERSLAPLRNPRAVAA
jgi:glyoxalase family protein